MRVIVEIMRVIGVNMHVIGMQTTFVSGMPKCVYVEGHPNV